MQEQFNPALELSQLQPSPTNPRKTFDVFELTNLADSIRTQGVIQPIVVRTTPNGYYEIVSGERRFRASLLAGKTTIPAMIRELTTEQVLEIQIVENLQRQDVDPIEEAQAFNFLHSNYKSFTSEEIALRVGKSASYVRTRMQLCKLIPEAQQLMRDKHLTIGHCTILARLNEEQQKNILDWLVEYDQQEDGTRVVCFVCDVADTKEHVQKNYMLDLALAKFDTKDEKLCPEAGSCHLCPKRTGYNLSLFEDLDDKDRCTDAKCWNTKLDAHVEKALKNKKILAITSKDKEGCISSYEITETEDLDEQGAHFDKKKVKQGIFVDGHRKGLVIEFILDEDLASAVSSSKTKAAATEIKVVKKKWDPSQYTIRAEIEKRIIQSVVSSELTAHEEHLQYVIVDLFDTVIDDENKKIILNQLNWVIINDDGEISADLDDYSPELTVQKNVMGKTEQDLIEIVRIFTMVKMIERELGNDSHFSKSVANMLEYDGISVEAITEEYRQEWEAENGSAD
jgi:ParB/RepB/Spo0J family partition protein